MKKSLILSLLLIGCVESPQQTKSEFSITYNGTNVIQCDSYRIDPISGVSANGGGALVSGGSATAIKIGSDNIVLRLTCYRDLYHEYVLMDTLVTNYTVRAN